MSEDDTEKKNKLEQLHELLDKAKIFSQIIHEQSATIQYSNQTKSPKKSPTKKSDKNLQSKLDDLGEKNKSETKTLPQPVLVTGGTLTNYQLEGVNWLIKLYENGLNGILADEMGLGKTVQTISFLAHLWQNGVRGPFLVVVPLSTLSNWKNEVQRWTPTIPVLVYYGPKAERANIRKEVLPRNKKTKTSDGKAKPPKVNLAIVVTTFDIAIRDKFFFGKIHWKYLVVDEAHRLKNFECKLIKELRRFESDNRLLLTGTPLQNNLTELWSLLNFTLPDIFDNVDNFRSWFEKDLDAIVEETVHSDIHDEGDGEVKTEEKGGKDAEKKSLDSTKTTVVTSLVQKLHSLLSTFMLRRLKADVEKDRLPKKVHILLYCPMTQPQKMFYKLLQDKSSHVKKTNLRNLVMQLRKVCNHPFLFDDDYDRFVEKFKEAQDSGKTVEEVIEINEEEEDEKKRKEDEEEGIVKRGKLRSQKRLDYSEHTKLDDMIEADDFSELNKDDKKNNSKKKKKSAAINKKKNSKRKRSDSDDDEDEKSGDEKEDAGDEEEDDGGDEDDGDDAVGKNDRKKGGDELKKYKTSFNFFLEENRQKFSEEAESNAELFQLAGQEWQKLSAEEKKPYIIKSQKDKEAYQQKLLEFRKEEDPNLIIDDPVKYLEHLRENSGKLGLLSRLLPMLKKKGHKVILFSQMTRMLDILEDFAEYSGINYVRIDGSTKMEDRQSAVSNLPVLCCLCHLC
eukprot:TRINITY_DN6301_c0_g1_i1.p1 TRINITY_DN6301_c0_g1~~TRINITY_DN6301_c0_g1_i1.p1  ORF type:complete len:732 (+),score=236.74 TRINITY_DN6301_c0_g1_i1:87-2282(+)